MATLLIASILILIIVIIFEIIMGMFKLSRVLGMAFIGAIMVYFVLGFDFEDQFYEKEVWSGIVTDWAYEPAREEKVPLECSGDYCTGGNTEYHPAEFYVWTTDGGWIAVSESLDGQTNFSEEKLSTPEQIAYYWPYGTPSASLHDYSIHTEAAFEKKRNKEIKEKDYPDLPDYPDQVTRFIQIDRIVGQVPNRDEALHALAMANAERSEYFIDPEDDETIWPEDNQANLVFVNLGPDRGENYGLALQNKWKNGRKNDFIVSFSMNEDGALNWIYSFSWSDNDTLKAAVQSEMMAMAPINDFVPVVERVSELVADQFEGADLSEYGEAGFFFTPSWAAIFKLCLCVIALLLFQAWRIRVS